MNRLHLANPGWEEAASFARTLAQAKRDEAATIVDVLKRRAKRHEALLLDSAAELLEQVAVSG